jgi:UDP-glucose 4-epimerase
MKILVTGGLGFIGHNVVRGLEQLGHSVVITDTRTTYGIVPQYELDYLIAQRRQRIVTDQIHSIDIADQDGIAWLIRHHQPDAVVHLASFPRQKVVNANPQLGSRAMSEGLLNLLEAARKHQVCKFVYISSSMVYGDFAGGVTETAECRPQGQYGIMKLAGEWLVRDYTRSTGMSHVILRPSAVYGPGDVEDRVISKFLTTANRGDTIRVNGADEVLDFTYVDDAANGITAATVSQHSTNQTYNITRGHGHTLAAAAELAVQIAGQGTIELRDRDLSFPSRGALDISAARRDLGFDPQIDINVGFQRYYDWLVNNPIYGTTKTV